MALKRAYVFFTPNWSSPVCLLSTGDDGPPQGTQKCRVGNRDEVLGTPPKDMPLPLEPLMLEIVDIRMLLSILDQTEACWDKMLNISLLVNYRLYTILYLSMYIHSLPKL